MTLIKKQTKEETLQRLYDALRESGEIPITESSDIYSKGIYLSKDDTHEIYIKQAQPIKEKLHVLLHEYSHYVHLIHYFNQESRAECEIIANGAAFVVCGEYEVNAKAVDLSKFSHDPAVVDRLSNTIQSVATHILHGVRKVQGGR